MSLLCSEANIGPTGHVEWMHSVTGKKCLDPSATFASDHFFQMSYKDNSSKWLNKDFTSGLSFELLRCSIQEACLHGHPDVFPCTLMVYRQHGVADVHTPQGRRRACVSFVHIL